MITFHYALNKNICYQENFNFSKLLGVLNNEKSHPFSFIRAAVVVVIIENDLKYVISLSSE
jgi:hypothetical protein